MFNFCLRLFKVTLIFFWVVLIYAQENRINPSYIDILIEQIQNEDDDLIGALDLFDEALEQSKKINYKEGIFKLYFYSAKIYRKIGHFQEALKNYSLAENIVNELKLSDWQAKIINNKAIVYYYKNDLNTCINTLKIAVPIYNEKNLKLDEAILLGNIAYIYFEKAVYDSAIFYNEKALNIHQDIKSDNQYLFGTWLNFVKYYNKFGEYKKSVKYAEELSQNKKVYNDNDYLIDLHTWWARSLAALKQFKAARRKLKIAEENLHKFTDTLIKADYFRAKSEVFALMGNNHDALDYLEKALKFSDSVNTASNNILLDQFKKRLENERDLATKKSIEVIEQKNTSDYLKIILALFFATIIVAYIGYSTKKKTEQVEKEKNKELNILNTKFEAFLEQTSEAIRLAESNGKVVIWNKASEKLTGIERSEVLGMDYLEMIKRTIPENYQEEYLKWAKYILNSAKDKKAFESKMDVIQIKAGSENNIYVQSKVFPIYLEDQVFIAGTTLEVTQRIQYEKGLLEAKELAESSDRKKTEFLAQMSHEIRTPINTILNFYSLIEMEFEKEMDNELRSSFDMINSSGEKIIKMMDTLLNISEIESGMVEIRKTHFDLYDKVIKPLIPDYSRQASKKNLEFNIKKSENNFVFGDEYTINQIFKNLLDNAIKYTETGHVSIEIKNFENKLSLTVKDTGVGFSEETLEEVLSQNILAENVFSVKNLGLILIKKYCELNDISISIKSRKNEGSEFGFLFQKK